MEVIEKIVNHAKAISKGEVKTVMPGNPLAFSDACTVNDRIWQGDLALTISNCLPSNYVKAKKPSQQLVKGNNEGAKHCLDSLDGVEMYHPKEWNEESLVGPYLILHKERVVQHPKHGNVTVKAGTEIHCTYQRERDNELARDRRARD